MAVKAAIKDIITASRTLVCRSKLFFCKTSTASKNPAPTIAGIDNNIENLAATRLSMPRKRDIVIVRPARLAPGIMAHAWARPIKNAFPIVMWVIFLIADRL